MKRLYLPLILFFLVVFEGVALDLLPVNLISGNLIIIPHWVLIFLLLITIFFEKEETYFSVAYALIFGLLIDIVYTGILGVYMFTYALTIYIIRGMTKLLHANIWSSVLFSIIGIIIADLSINIIYSVIGISVNLGQDYFLWRLMPTVLANILFLLIIYPFVIKKFPKWQS